MSTRWLGMKDKYGRKRTKWNRPPMAIPNPLYQRKYGAPNEKAQNEEKVCMSFKYGNLQTEHINTGAIFS